MQMTWKEPVPKQYSLLYKHHFTRIYPSLGQFLTLEFAHKSSGGLGEMQGQFSLNFKSTLGFLIYIYPEYDRGHTKANPQAIIYLKCKHSNPKGRGSNPIHKDESRIVSKHEF